MPWINGKWVWEDDDEVQKRAKERRTKKFDREWVPYSQRDKTEDKSSITTIPKSSDYSGGEPGTSDKTIRRSVLQDLLDRLRDPRDIQDISKSPSKSPSIKIPLEESMKSIQPGQHYQPTEPQEEPTKPKIPYANRNLTQDDWKKSQEKIEESAEKEPFSLKDSLGKVWGGLKKLDTLSDVALYNIKNTLSFGLMGKLDQMITRDMTDEEKRKLGIYTDDMEPQGKSEEIAGKTGEVIGSLVGGGAAAKSASALLKSPVTKGIGQRAKDMAATGNVFVKSSQVAPRLPKPTVNVPMSNAERLTRELAKLGVGTAAFAGSQEFVEGFTDPDIEERNAVQTFAASTRSGIFDMYEQMGSALKWADFNETGKKFQEYARQNKEGFETNYTKEFSWKSFLDPDFYQTTVARALPSVFSTMPLAIMGSVGGSAVGGLLGMGALGRTILATIGGTALSAPAESAMIAGGVYEEALSRGDDEAAANEKARNTFYKALAVTAVTQAPELAAIFGPIRRFIPQVQRMIGPSGDFAARTGIASVSEGTQEALQEWAAMSELGEEFSFSDPEVRQSFSLGALIGGGMGAIGAIGDVDLGGQDIVSPTSPDNPVNRIKAQVKETMTDEVKQQFDQAFDNAINNGLDQDQAEAAAFEAIARTEKGQQLIQDATIDIVDKEAKNEFREREATGNMPDFEVPPKAATFDFPSVQEFQRLTESPEQDLAQPLSQPTIEPTTDADIQPTTQSQRPFGPFSQTSVPQGPAIPRPDQVSTPSFGTPLTEQQRQQAPSQGPRQPVKKGDLVRVQGEQGLFEVAEDSKGGKKQRLIGPDGKVRNVRHGAISRVTPMVFREGDTVNVQGREGVFTVDDLRRGQRRIKVVDQTGNEFFVNRQQLSLAPGRLKAEQEQAAAESAPESAAEPVTTQPEERKGDNAPEVVKQEWKDMKNRFFTMGKRTPGHRVKVLEEMKEFAETHGLDFSRFEKHLENFREMDKKQKAEKKADREQSKAEKQRQEREAEERKKAREERERSEREDISPDDQHINDELMKNERFRNLSAADKKSLIKKIRRMTDNSSSNIVATIEDTPQKWDVYNAFNDQTSQESFNRLLETYPNRYTENNFDAILLQNNFIKNQETIEPIGQTEEQAAPEMSEEERAVRLLLRDNPNMTIDEISDELMFQELSLSSIEIQNIIDDVRTPQQEETRPEPEESRTDETDQEAAPGTEEEAAVDTTPTPETERLTSQQAINELKETLRNNEEVRNAMIDLAVEKEQSKEVVFGNIKVRGPIIRAYNEFRFNKLNDYPNEEIMKFIDATENQKLEKEVLNEIWSDINPERRLQEIYDSLPEPRFKVGDTITFSAKRRKERVKGEITEVQKLRTGNRYEVKPIDTVLKSEFFTDEDALQPFGEEPDQEETTPTEETLAAPQEETAATDKVVTAAGTEIDIQYEIVPMAELIYSHNSDGRANPDFPKNLQPRQRDAADSKIQAQNMARNLDPKRLLDNRLASDGAPIVGSDNVVESGNGRMMALEYMNLNTNRETLRNNGEQYFEEISRFARERGLMSDEELAFIENPVLIRRRTTPMNDSQREQFAAEANESNVARMGSTETALADAKKLGRIIHLFVPSDSGEINTLANQQFIKLFINEVVPAADRRAVRTKEGYLSQDGKDRLERALFALAYDDENAIARYSEDLDDNARTVTGAMVDVAPKMAVLNGEIENNVILPEFEINKDIVQAFNKLVELRRGNVDIEQWIREDRDQLSFDEEMKLSDVAYELLHQFNVKKSRKRIRNILNNYLELVMDDPRSQGEDLFGERATKQEFLTIAIERVDGGGSLFEVQSEIGTEQAQAPDETDRGKEREGTQATQRTEPEETTEFTRIDPLPENPEDVESDHFRQYTNRMKSLVDNFIDRIENDNLPSGRGSQKELRQIAGEFLGRPPLEDEWRDALEVAVQLVAQKRRVENPNMSLKERIDLGKELEQNMKVSARSLEQMERQQYSTPIPLAEIANYAADPKNTDNVKEGSAGTGSLIIPMFGQVNQINANELSPRRAALLEILKTEEPNLTVNNDDTFNFKTKATLVIGNPPFRGQNVAKGSVALSGKAPWKGGWGDLGNRFLNWDLRSLPDGGRLVYITSPGVIDNKQNAAFRKWLQENHTVRAMIKFPPEIYETRGTKFGAGMIVVDKGKVGDAAPITGEPKTLEELEEMLLPLREGGTHARVEVVQPKTRKESPSGTRGSGKGPGVRQPTPRPRRGEPATKPTDSDRVELDSYTDPDGNIVTGERLDRPDEDRSNGGPTEQPGLSDKASEVLPEKVPRETVQSKSDELSTAEGNQKSVGPSTDNVPSITGYVPRRRVTNAEHRGNVIEAPGMQFVNIPEAIYTDNQYLPHETVIKGGEWILSDVQIESVMAAKYNYLEHDKRGILIADDTGMGKTAQLLGIAADAWHSGRNKRILIVTTKDQVASSSFLPENKNFGFDIPMIHINPDYADKHENNFKDKTKHDTPELWQPFDYGDGAIVMSKYTFRSSQEAVTQWLDEADGDVMILVDESHDFKNIESKTGEAMKNLFKRFKDQAQFNYASATAAEDIEGLEHLFGLKLWGPENFVEFEQRLTGSDPGTVSGGRRKTGLGKAMSKKSPFERSIPLTLMEQITREMKMEGQYIGRQLSMEGVSMEGMNVKLAPTDKGDWNRSVQFVQMIADKAEEHGNKPTDRGRIMGSVVGYMRRLRSYYALKGIIQDIQAQQKSGNFKRFAISAFFKSGDEGQPAQLQSAINAINDLTKATDATGDEITVSIPEAVEDKADLQAILEGLDPEWGEKPVPEIPSPIEMLYQAFGEENVAVIHGDVSVKNRSKVVKEFQDGKKPIIWFNQAGATGVNMHDTFGEPIRFYHQDYPYSAKEAKQSEGRVNRTGQVTTPIYVYPYLDTSVDTKFVGTLMARYEAMGALSRGDTGKLGGQELSSFDFTGPAVEEAAYRIIPLLEPDIRAQMFGNWTRDMFEDPESASDRTAIRSVYSGNKVEVKKFMNALMMLDFDEGNRVFQQFTDLVDVVKAELEARGGLVDKFQTYDGLQLDIQEGKQGLKLRKIKTKLTEQQDRQLKTKLKQAKILDQEAKENLATVRENVVEKQEESIKAIEKTQNNEKKEFDKVIERMKPLTVPDATDKQIKELERLRIRRDKLDDSISKRAIRLRELKQKLADIKAGKQEVIETVPDIRRAQTQADRAEMMLLSAESEIEKSDEVLLIDGRIATNGLLVPIRKAIRKAADKHFQGKTPASALNVELRGYYLDNGQRVVGAIVPKWAEGEVAQELEARMSFAGDTGDIARLKEHIKNGNPVTLENGFEIRWRPNLEQYQIWGMTPTQHRSLFEQLVGDKNKPDIGYHQTSRSFVILTDNGFKKIIERYPIQTNIDERKPPGGDRPPSNLNTLNMEVDRVFNAKKSIEPDRKVSPKAAKQLADLIAKHLETVLRSEKTPRKTILGQFSPKTGTGRVRPEHLQEFSVIAHELGHAFSHRFKFKGDMNELIKIAETYYPSELKGRKLKMEEGLAEYFQLWFVDPEEVERLAPKTTELLNEFLSENPELNELFTHARTVIDNDLRGTPIQRALGSIVGVDEKRLTEHVGEEYKIGDVSRFPRLMKVLPVPQSLKQRLDRFIQKQAVKVFDFTIPFRDLYNKAKENDFEGTDFVKLMAISGAAVEKSRRAFSNVALDHRGRKIINYKSREELPDFLVPKYDELHQKYKSAEKALAEINDRTLQVIMSDAMEHIATRTKDIRGTDLEKLSEGLKLEQTLTSASDIFGAVAQAYRYNERYERGFRNNPMERDVADGTIRQARELFPELDSLVKEYTHNLSTIILDKLQRAGVITAQAKKNIMKGSTFYVPTFYATESTPTPSGKSQAGKTAGLPVKKYGGKKQAVHHILTATMMKLNEVEQAIEYKRVLDGIEGALRTKETGMFGEIIPENRVPIKFSAAQIESQMDEFINESSEDQDIGNKVLSIFVPGGLQSFGNKPVIMNWHDKKRVYMRLAPDLFNSLMAMRPADVKGFMRFMAKLSGITRYSVTALNPRYIFNAISRDFVSAGVQREGSRNVIKGTFKGALYALEDTKLGKKILRHAMDKRKVKSYDDLIDQYMASGAFMSATENVLQGLRRSSITDGLLPTDVKNVKKSPVSRTLNVLGNFPGEIMRAQEQMQRFTEFEERIRTLAAENNIDPEIILDGSLKIPKGKEKIVEKILVDAAYAASEITSNFSLHGSSEFFRHGGSAITFLHGTLQGIYREIRALRRGSTTIPRLALYTLPVTVAAWAMLQAFSDDEEEIPSHTKDRYWIFQVPGTPYKLTVGKPFMYALPVNYLERFLDDLLGDLDGDVNEREWNEDLINPLKEAFSIPFAPPILSTMIDLKANEQWHGGPIVPVGEERIAVTERFDYFRTSDASIAMSRLLEPIGIKFSPRQMDYFFRNTFGFLGEAALWTGSIPASAFVEDRPEKEGLFSDPFKEGIERAPLVGGLLLGETEGGSRTVDRFYQRSAESTELYNTTRKWFEQFRETGSIDHIKKRITPQDIELLKYYPVFNKYSSIMKQIRDEERAIRKSDQYTPEQKKQAKLKTDYYIRVIANSPFGHVPTPPTSLNITQEEIDYFALYIRAEGNKAYQRDIQTPDTGASLYSRFLDEVYNLRNR